MREISYKAVLYSKSLNRYFVSDALRVDTGLACLFGFENQLEAQFNDLILCSERFVKEIKEDWWMRDWVHIGNIESTGLKDKNGVEIYEWDIVSSGRGKGMAVIYQAPKFVMKEKIKSGFSKCWSEFILSPDQNQFEEVIGNIYENPELLEA